MEFLRSNQKISYWKFWVSKKNTKIWMPWKESVTINLNCFKKLFQRKNCPKRCLIFWLRSVWILLGIKWNCFVMKELWIYSKMFIFMGWLRNFLIKTGLCLPLLTRLFLWIKNKKKNWWNIAKITHKHGLKEQGQKTNFST